MYIPEKLGLLSARDQPPGHKTPAVLGVTTPIVGVFAAALGYLCWRKKKRRRRSRRSSRHDGDFGPVVSANGFILGDVWDDGGGFDPDPRRRARGPSAPDTFIRGDVWDDGGGFDPDPRRRNANLGPSNHGAEVLLDDVWNEGESDGHVDVHPSRRDRLHSTRPPRRRSTEDRRPRRRHHRDGPSRRRHNSVDDVRRNRRHRRRRRRSTNDEGGGGGDRHERIQGDVWNEGEAQGHVDRDPGGREPSIAHSVTGNSHVFGTDDIDDRSFRTATVSVDEPSDMPTYPARAHLPDVPANLNDDLFSEDGSEIGAAEGNRLALELRLALHGAALST
ncbi:hypothetical protein PpBr36_04385 [Pyricularia pennisetigena]|uniref:hypothetical protein n=1 Tax=Pyricularia pennisetigena TaxID=1578925 RepID=UPI0011529A8C|nr:hypothetical protein PpBr36_04385 [Pyricularia pennisetigena]TLS27116.1 hypothetical protein PpBr36_04385 [Pyricularia pennisetigena]